MPDKEASPAPEVVSVPLRASRVPLGPRGPPKRSPFNEYLNFDILQVSRDDLSRWLGEIERDAAAQVLTINWKDGSHDTFLTPEAPNANRLLDIAQVEEVEAIAYSARYDDGSEILFNLRRAYVTLRSGATQPNSIAQHLVYAVRNLIEASEAVRVPRLDRTRPIVAFGVVLAFAILVSATLTSLLTLFPDHRATALVALGVITLASGIAAGFWLRGTRLRRRLTDITDPLVIAYPPRNQLSKLAVFGIVVGIATIITMVAAIVVIFYSPDS